MYKDYFSLFLLIHILGDFYFQGEKMAPLKNKKISILLLHSFIHLFTSIIIIIPVFKFGLLLYSLLISLTHFIIDSLKSLYYRYCIKKEISYNERNAYVADQALHIITLLIISYFAFINLGLLNLLGCVNKVLVTMEIPVIATLKGFLVLLIIWKPANITIRTLMIPYRSEEIADDNVKKAGKFIGTLERLIIFALLIINQFSVIGLVLTAKSIARYDKISKDKAFAEYYLLGTLSSTLIVLAAYLIIC